MTGKTPTPTPAPGCDSEAAAAAASRERFARTAERLRQAGQALQTAVDDLPRFTKTSTCCPNPDLKVVTDCLSPWCNFNRERLSASTNGWNDMGDMEGPEYLQCQSCDATWRTPERMNWR